MDKILITTGGFALIAFVWWFFFGKRDGVIAAGETINVLVDGGYRPSVIKIKNGQRATINLIRKDKSSCLEEIIIPDFKIKEYLPLNKKVGIEITPDKTGEFAFHCGMNMFHGKIIVI